MRYNIRKKRWHPDSNWGMEALQASALPLGHATLCFLDLFVETRPEAVSPNEELCSRRRWPSLHENLPKNTSSNFRRRNQAYTIFHTRSKPEVNNPIHKRQLIFHPDEGYDTAHEADFF